MWHNRLKKYLLKEWYVNKSISPFIFIKKSKTIFAIIAIYVDELNFIETSEELTRIANYLKKEFRMKGFRKTKFCLNQHITNFFKWNVSLSVNKESLEAL